jgi:maltose/moltooligosaccharide transporter
VRFSFYIGAAAFLCAVLWTVLTTKEYPPENMAEFRKQKAERAGIAAGVREILVSVREMPRTMRQLAWVQISTWLGLFCMWLYFPVAVPRNVFGATGTNSPLYSAGAEWAGVCFGMYSLVCFAFSFALPAIALKLGRKATHSLCLICGGLGLLSVAVIRSKYPLLLSMTGVGIAWASTLSMPYSILSGSLPPEKTGVYMGIFNSFVVIPEIVASLGFGWMMDHLLNNNRLAAVVAGGVFFILAALLTQKVQDLDDPHFLRKSAPVDAGAARLSA